MITWFNAPSSHQERSMLYESSNGEWGPSDSVSSEHYIKYSNRAELQLIMKTSLIFPGPGMKCTEPNLLLLKATSQATLLCLDQCLGVLRTQHMSAPHHHPSPPVTGVRYGFFGQSLIDVKDMSCLLLDLVLILQWKGKSCIHCIFCPYILWWKLHLKSDNFQDLRVCNDSFCNGILFSSYEWLYTWNVQNVCSSVLPKSFCFMSYIKVILV